MGGVYTNDLDYRKTEHLEFILLERKPKTNVYDVVAVQGCVHLGVIKWHSGWRRYCFFAASDTIFDASCLGIIRLFIVDLMEDRKKILVKTKEKK